jgi:hypothetical protein
MKQIMTPLVLAVGLVASAITGRAQNPAATALEDPAHQELRTIKEAMVKAFNARDYAGFLRYLHPNVVATWQNSEVARHPAGVEAFMRKMSEGDAKVVERVQADLKVDELTSLYLDKNTGVAFGAVDQDFEFASGKHLQLTSRWTATFVKENGHWLLVAFHVSANIFDNPIITLAVKKTALGMGVGSALIGLIAGWMLGRLRKAKALSPS